MDASNNVTWCPRRAASSAAAIPATPAPITATRLARGAGSIGEFALPRSARIDQATDDLAGEVMIETGLIAGDADIDEIRPAAPDLVHEISVREKRARHRDEIRRTVGNHLGCVVRQVDPVAGGHRDRNRLLQSARRFDEGRMRNRARDGRHGRLRASQYRLTGNQRRPLSISLANQIVSASVKPPSISSSAEIR